MSTYEFSSFRAMNDHLHNAPAIRGRKPEPWLPAGPNPSHFRTLGLSSKEEVAAIATKSQEEVEREGVEPEAPGGSGGNTNAENAENAVIAEPMVLSLLDPINALSPMATRSDSFESTSFITDPLA